MIEVSAGLVLALTVKMTTHGGKLVYEPWPEDIEYFEREALVAANAGSLSLRGAAPGALPAPLHPAAGGGGGRGGQPELPALPGWASLTQPQRYLLLSCAGLLLLLAVWWGGSGQDVAAAPPPLPPQPQYLISPAALSSPSSRPAPASALQPEHPPPPPAGGQPPSPSAPPLGQGAGGPVVGAWGLRDAVLPNALTFLALGDWGRGGRGGQEVTAPPLAAWAAATGASFVVSVGDSVYVDGVPPGSSPAEVDAIMRAQFSDVYTAPALASLPWHAIFGNHDYRGDVGAQAAWRGDARWRAGLNFTKRWRLPGGGSGTAHPRACLAAVFTDTSPLIAHYAAEGSYAAAHPVLAANVRAVDGGALVAWTQRAIARATGACDAVMVFGHHPLLSPGEHGDTPELLRHYRAALEGGGVDAYVAGHDHVLGHSREPGGGVEHVLTGGGSEVRYPLSPGPATQWVATVRGFSVHSVNATHAAHSYVYCDDAGEGFSEPGLPGRVAFHVLRRLREKPAAAAPRGGA